MKQCFHDQIGKNLEAYIDDIVVKSKKACNLVSNLEVTFANLRKNSIKLNLKKCVFGVPKGKLLGFMVIEANVEKISAIQNMGLITNIKGVQRLTGCLASLSRFISRLGERGMPLYKLLKKSDQFRWTEEAQMALDKIKGLLDHTTSAGLLDGKGTYPAVHHYDSASHEHRTGG